jgi:hypothetical protein
MKQMITVLGAAFLAFATSPVTGQSSEATKQIPEAKAGPSSSATKPSSEAAKYKPTGKETAETMQSNATFKGSKPVDKNAKATHPHKPVKEMTPEQRAQRRQEISKEAKP